MKEIYEKYKVLRKEIDSKTKQLEKEHQKHMQCKAGCDFCCMDYSILPIEFYSILNELKTENTKPDTNLNAESDQCIFLKEHKCSIYAERPIICRTHGLPLLFMNDEGEWELSACELNFTEFNLESFTPENTFAQDKYNSRLFMLNKEFISSYTEKKFDEFDLIPVKELFKNL